MSRSLYFSNLFLAFLHHFCYVQQLLLFLFERVCVGDWKREDEKGSTVAAGLEGSVKMMKIWDKGLKLDGGE